MKTTKLNDIMNRFLENREFKYKGPILPGESIPNSDIDIKIKVVGTKELIVVGEYYDYTVIDIVLVRFNDKFSSIFFNESFKPTSEMLSNFSIFSWLLEDYVRSILKPFDMKVKIKVNSITYL
jgi:hypothetical protein